MSEGITTKATETVKSGAAAIGLGGNSNNTNTTTTTNTAEGETKQTSTEGQYHNSTHAKPGDASTSEHGLDPNTSVHPTQGSTKAPEFLKDLGKSEQSSTGALPASDRPTQPPTGPGASNV